MKENNDEITPLLQIPTSIINQENSTSLIKDKFSFVWLIFVLFGLGALFPWNSFIITLNYFEFLFPNFPFSFTMSLIFNYASVIFLLLSIQWGSKFSFKLRIVGPFIIDFFVLLSIPIITQLFSNILALIFSLVGIFFSGIATAILCGSIVGLSSLFPSQYIGATMSGNGIAGLLSILIQVIVKLSDSNKGYQYNAIIYFGTASFIMLICIISYYMLTYLPFAQYYINQNNEKYQQYQKEQENTKVSNTQFQNNKIIFKKIWKESLLIFLNFFLTLSLFPGITSLIKSNSNISNDWFQFIMLSLFMIFDYIGRTIPKWIRLFKPNIIWIPVILRFIFIMLFLFCIKPKYFTNDIISFILMSLFALTNGYCGTLLIMYGPNKVEYYEKEASGVIMVFFLNFGIFVGAHFAFLLLFLINGKFTI